MKLPGVDDEWTAHGALTIPPAHPGGRGNGATDEVATATAAVAALCELAAQVMASGSIPPTYDPPAPCPLPGCDAEMSLCDLTRRLAATTNTQVAPEVHPDVLMERYVLSLADIGAAVRTCRRVLHASGRCLFGRQPDLLCGQVLAAAHRLSEVLGPPVHGVALSAPMDGAWSPLNDDGTSRG